MFFNIWLCCWHQLLQHVKTTCNHRTLFKGLSPKTSRIGLVIIYEFCSKTFYKYRTFGFMGHPLNSIKMDIGHILKMTYRLKPYCDQFTFYDSFQNSFRFGTILLPWSRNRDKGGITGQQGMLSPPRHLLICTGVCVCPSLTL